MGRSKPSCVRRDAARGGEVQHPRQVFGQDEMEGAAHRPRSDHVTGVQCRLDALAGARLGSQRDRGDGSRIVLCLHSREPAHSVGCRGETGSGNALRGESEQGDVVQRRHVYRIVTLGEPVSRRAGRESGNASSRAPPARYDP